MAPWRRRQCPDPDDTVWETEEGKLDTDAMTEERITFCTQTNKQATVMAEQEDREMVIYRNTKKKKPIF